MPPVQYVLVERNAEGVLVDAEGNKYNSAGDMIDDWGNVIPDPEEEPATSSLGNGNAGVWQPQTLADYNDPYLFYHRRAEIQVDMDCLDEEPPEQDFQFQEIPDSEILARIQRTRVECAAWFKNLDAIFFPARNTEGTNQEEELTEVRSECEEKAEFDVSGSVSVDREVSVDRHMPKFSESDENLAKSESEVSSVIVSVDMDLCVDRHGVISSEPSSELVSVDMDLCVDRYKEFPSQASYVGVSVDTVLCVDRQEPSPHVSDVLERIDKAEPQPKPPVHVPDPPDPAPDLKPPDPGPHERLPDPKPPDPILQPSPKRLRAYPGAAVIIPIAAYIIDPGDTYAVYSRGPRPPPPEKWYVLFELPSSLAGRCSYPP